MTPLFTCEIPGRVAIKKNSTQRRYSFAKKRTFTMPSDRYMIWQNMAVGVVTQQFLRSQIKTIDHNVFAKFYFYFKNHMSESDTSNCIEGPADVLTKSRVIVDDKLITSLYAEKLFGMEPRVIVELYNAKETR